MREEELGATARPLVDTHCHLDDPELLPDIEGVLERARAAGHRLAHRDRRRPRHGLRAGCGRAGAHLRAGLDYRTAPAPGCSAKRFADRSASRVAQEPLVVHTRLVPRDRLLLETSSPFHPPKARPGRNEPALLALVAEHVAALVGLRARELLDETSANAIRRFGLDTLPGAGRASLTVLAGP
jgi:hypothetical protein